MAENRRSSLSLSLEREREREQSVCMLYCRAIFLLVSTCTYVHMHAHTQLGFCIYVHTFLYFVITKYKKSNTYQYSALPKFSHCFGRPFRNFECSVTEFIDDLGSLSNDLAKMIFSSPLPYIMVSKIKRCSLSLRQLLSKHVRRSKFYYI